MSKRAHLNKKDITAFISIVLLMIAGLIYGFSTLKTDTVDGPKVEITGGMTDECKKIWLEKGEEEAVKNGC